MWPTLYRVWYPIELHPVYAYIIYIYKRVVSRVDGSESSIRLYGKENEFDYRCSRNERVKDPRRRRLNRTRLETARLAYIIPSELSGEGAGQKTISAGKILYISSCPLLPIFPSTVPFTLFRDHRRKCVGRFRTESIVVGSLEINNKNINKNKHRRDDEQSHTCR